MSVGLVLKDPPAPLVAELAAAAEARGLTHLLFTELSVPGMERITGRDPFVLASVALGATRTLRAGTGVVGTIFHTARHLALRAATLQEQSGGRFVLGCGVAHERFAVEVGVRYPASPLAHVREYCAELRRVCDRLAFGAGFPVWLAALGERMALTAATCADGLVLNWVSPAHAARTMARAREARGGPVTAAVFVRTGPAAALRAAAEGYQRLLPSYARHFARQGLASPEEVVAATCVAQGDPGALAERIAAYREAGVSAVLLYPADVPPGELATVVDRIGQE